MARNTQRACLRLLISVAFTFTFFSVFSTDEQATESILKAQQSYVNLAGLLDLKTTRDAFVTALCKASLPPHYQLLVLNQPGMWDGVSV